jgi:hypothetical protein
LLCVLRAEAAKLRSVRVLLPALTVPAGYVMLKGAVFVLRGEDGLGADRYTFEYMFSIGQLFWDRLLIPLLAVTVCAWLVWLESDNGGWKVLLVQPVPRGSVYLAKLFAAFAALILLQGCWWLFHGLLGLALDLHGRETIGVAAVHAFRIAAALTPVVGVQLLLSVLLRNPFVALGIGILGNTASLVLAGTAANPWHPWGLAQVAGQPTAAAWTLWAAVGATAVLSWAGVARLSRMDV